MAENTLSNNDISQNIDHKGHNIVVLNKTINDGTEALAPEQFTGLTLGKPDKKAVGIPAILSSVHHAFKWMKPTDAVRTMFKINQKGGFDCPGCAWPDPDDDRSGFARSFA